MGKNISFILGAAIALGGACFGMNMTGGVAQNGAHISKAEAIATSLGLPLHAAQFRPEDAIALELGKRDLVPAMITKSVFKDGGATSQITALVDLFYADRYGIGLLAGNGIYSNKCTVSGDTVTSEIVFRRADDPVSEIYWYSASRKGKILGTAQCQALKDAGAFDVDDATFWSKEG